MLFNGIKRIKDKSIRIFDKIFSNMNVFQNECSFVSLRDVERAIKVILWFYSNSDLIARVIDGEDRDGDDESDEELSEEGSDRSYVDDDDEDVIHLLTRAQVQQVRFSFYT